MPFTKTFGTTAGSWATATNWLAISLRNANFAWTASGSGTDEYYVRTAGGADPGILAQPGNIYINGSNATEGTAGSLTAGQWDYADNDSLGYSTVYVRLSGGGDPDAQDVDHVKMYQIPIATEHVRWARDSASLTAGLSQSGVAIGDFIVEEGCEAELGSATLGYLYIDPDRFEFHGNAQCRIDIGAAAISPHIYTTASPNEGERGLYLRGSAISVLNIMGGHVGLAVLPGEIATATTCRLMNASGDSSVWVGNLATLTNFHQYGGTSRVRCGTTAAIVYDGTMLVEENGAHTAVTMHAGEFVYQSSGNITTFNLYGGILDLQRSGAARTIGTLNKYRGQWNILRNKEAVTITTETAQETYTESGST